MRPCSARCPALRAAWELKLSADLTAENAKNAKMKTMIKNLFVLTLAGFVFTGCATHRCCKTRELEYKTVNVIKAVDSETLQKEINAASKGGWKLVSVTSQSDSFNNLILERPKH